MFVLSFLSQILIAVAVSLGLLVVWKKRNLYYHAWSIPGPLAFPIIGNTYAFFGHKNDIIPKGIRMMQKYKGICKVWLGSQLMVYITEPEYLQIAMKTSLEKGQTYKFVKAILRNGLATAPLEMWKKNRRLIAPVFNQKTVDTFLCIFNKYSNTLLKKVQSVPQGEYIDIFPLVHCCTVDMICEFALGIEANALTKGSDYVDWLHEAVQIPYQRSFNVLLHPEWIWKRTALSKRLDYLMVKIFEYVAKVIEDRKRLLDEEHTTPVLLDHLMALAKEGNWTDQHLLEEVQMTMIAGSDTTGTTISFCLLSLGIHRDIQEKVHEELFSVFGNSKRDATLEDLEKLTYLDRVIKETMRLFPVLMVIGRTIKRGVRIGPYVLPEGSELAIPLILLHRDERLFPEPFKFDPDRFLPEEEAKRHPFAYIPFSAGTRNCIGWRYAMLDMKTVVSTILRRYRLHSRDFDSVAEIELQGLNVVAASTKGYYLSFKEK